MYTKESKGWGSNLEKSRESPKFETVQNIRKIDFFVSRKSALYKSSSYQFDSENSMLFEFNV